MPCSSLMMSDLSRCGLISCSSSVGVSLMLTGPCPFCGQQHIHGGTAELQPGDSAGSRVPHCVQQSIDGKRDYVLVVAGPGQIECPPPVKHSISAAHRVGNRPPRRAPAATCCARPIEPTSSPGRPSSSPCAGFGEPQSPRAWLGCGGVWCGAQVYSWGAGCGAARTDGVESCQSASPIGRVLAGAKLVQRTSVRGAPRMFRDANSCRSHPFNRVL